MTARIYETGVDESDPEAILSRALKLKKSGSLRVFHDALSIGAKNALKPHLVGYFDAKMKRKSGMKSKAKKQAKGALGILVEKIVFGRTPNNKSEADFPSCQLELKVTGQREKDDEAKERVSLSMIPKEMVHGGEPYDKAIDNNLAYNKFGPIKSASQVLFITYKFAPQKAYLDAKITSAFIWKPSASQRKSMLDDFIIIRRMCDYGFAHCVGEGLGMFMGAATKSAGDEEGFEKPKAENNIKALMESLKGELSNPERFEIFRKKAESKLRKDSMIKRRCYSLKRKSVTEIISAHAR
jgi:DNA mismatch repair protein MutH